MSEGIEIYKRKRSVIEQRVDKELSKAIVTRKSMFARADDAAKKFGGTVVRNEFNIKSRDSILRKLKSEGLDNPSKLKDIVRTTIVVDEDKFEGATSYLSQKASPYTMSRTKKQTPQDFLGYSGYIANFRHGNGQYYEIQVQTPQMIYAKEPAKTAIGILGREKYMQIFREQRGLGGGYGHKLYEKHRVLKDKKSKTARSIERESQDYYRQFRKGK